MGIIKGIDDIERKTQETAALASGNWIRTLKIFDGEIAILRFVTDKDDIISAPFHSVKVQTNYGEKWRPQYCQLNDKGVCPQCQLGQKPGDQIFLWAYVYYILHKTQNRRLETDPNADRWTVQKVGTKTYYKEEVNKVMLFKTGPGAKGYIRNKLITEATDNGTLCDRNYKWSRIGGGKDDTSYDLKGLDSSDTPEEVLEASKNLPDLIKVVTGEVKTFGNRIDIEEDAVSEKSESFDDLF